MFTQDQNMFIEPYEASFARASVSVSIVPGTFITHKKTPKKASSFPTQKSHKKNRHITAPPKLQKIEAKTENTKRLLPFFYKSEDTEKSRLFHIPSSATTTSASNETKKGEIIDTKETEQRERKQNIQKQRTLKNPNKLSSLYCFGSLFLIYFLI